MAGIYHKYFNADIVGSDELHYFAITPDKLVSTISRNFKTFLERMGHLDYIDHKKPKDTHYFELIATSSAEFLFFSYLRQSVPSITTNEVRYFFRGSKRLPGGDPEDPEEEFWIIEPEKIQNIIQFLDHFDFDQALTVPSTLFYLDEKSNKFHPKGEYDLYYYDFEDILQIISFLYSNLTKGNIILCVWDQS